MWMHVLNKIQTHLWFTICFACISRDRFDLFPFKKPLHRHFIEREYNSVHYTVTKGSYISSRILCVQIELFAHAVMHSNNYANLKFTLQRSYLNCIDYMLQFVQKLLKAFKNKFPLPLILGTSVYPRKSEPGERIHVKTYVKNLWKISFKKMYSFMRIGQVVL